MKSSGTVDAGGTKVLLRHRKDRIVLSKCYERRILVYVVVVMFNTWKVSSCERQERLLAGGK